MVVQKKLLLNIGGISLILFVMLGAIYFFANKANEEYFSREGVVLCTMEAKMCPDGSAVSRKGPNCEFTPCPPVQKIEPVDIVPPSGGPGGIPSSPPQGSGGASGRKVVCTMDAKICPDGSTVGRKGPNCEFAPCPDASSTGRTSGNCTKESDCAPGYSCIDASPVVREGQQNLQCWKDGTPTPICLSGETMIATPKGEQMVKHMKAGDLVWSINGRGEKIAVPLIAAAHTAAPSDHRVVHLFLSDGRELVVSPGHKLANGIPVGSLRAGDSVDGSTVKSASLIPYGAKYTYDILPESETGMYWGNGIILQSTLAP